MSMNHWLEQAENLAIEKLKENGKKPEMFKKVKAHIGESGSVMFSPIAWWGSGGDDGIISASAGLLACCKFMREISNQRDPVKAMAAGRYIGRIMLALNLQGNDAITEEAKNLIISEASSEAGKQGKNIPKTWYTKDLDQMIVSLLDQKKKAQEVWAALPKMEGIGLIDSIESDDELGKIIIDPVLDGSGFAGKRVAVSIRFDAIQKRIRKINNKT